MAFNHNKDSSFFGDIKNVFTGYQGVKGIELDADSLAKVNELNKLKNNGKVDTDDWKKALDGANAEIKKLYENSGNAVQRIQQVGTTMHVGATGIEKLKLSLRGLALTVKAAALQFIVFFAVTEGIKELESQGSLSFTEQSELQELRRQNT